MFEEITQRKTHPSGSLPMAYHTWTALESNPILHGEKSVTVPSCGMVVLSFLCSVFQYTFALLLIFLLEAMVGIMSFLYEPHVADELHLNLNKTFIDNYKMDDSKTRAIDQMQIEVRF